MKTFVVLCVLGVSLAIPSNEDFLSDEFIASINAKNSTWTAQRHFSKNFNTDVIKGLMGVIKSPLSGSLPIVSDVDNSLPTSFDARHKWPYCKSLNVIHDEGCCGAGWAFGAVEPISDRICIFSQGKVQVEISAENLISCCNKWSLGCNGGDSRDAWEYWVENGLVTGGDYGSHQGCQPYHISPYKHDVPCPRNKRTPTCSHKCEPGYNSSFSNDEHFGKVAYQVDRYANVIATEILRHGPVQATFDVYADFLHYKSGVYQHLHGEHLGSHAVKILGWGVENGVDYWLAANSWSTAWGSNGYFRIRKGVYECGIEYYIVGGIPRL